MNIRKAAAGDVDTIHTLGESINEFAVNDETVNFWPKEALARAIQSNDTLILVAEDNAVAGFLIINYNHGFKKALIENIYVQPDKREQGIGDALLNEMFKELAKMGCEYVVTLVPPDAREAIDLYKRAGLSQGEVFLWLDKALASQFRKD